QAEDGIRDWSVTGVQTCALPIWVRIFSVTGASTGCGRPLRVRSHAREGRPHPVEAPVTEKILTRNFDRADAHTLAVYRETGGYTAWEKARSMEPSAITDEVKKANLRGLGGAGFPTGMKWSFVPKNHTG